MEGNALIKQSWCLESNYRSLGVVGYQLFIEADTCLGLKGEATNPAASQNSGFGPRPYPNTTQI